MHMLQLIVHFSFKLRISKTSVRYIWTNKMLLKLFQAQNLPITCTYTAAINKKRVQKNLQIYLEL